MKMNKLDLTLEITCGLFIIVTLIFTLANYYALPDILPRHFNISGQPDGYWNKENIWFLPTIILIAYIGLTILGRYPKSFNYPYEITIENADSQYRNSVLMIRTLKTLIVLMFAYMTYATVRIGLGDQAKLGALFTPIALSSILGTIIFFIYRGYRLR
jgi:uncharacterized membrane protein